MSRQPVSPSLIEPLPLRTLAAPVDLRVLHHSMQVVRAVETALSEAATRGELAGPVHVSLGQEAVAVGAVAAMDANDVMFSTHRGHGHALAMGLDPRRVLAEIVCHPEGYAGGVGGSMHLLSEAHGFLGTNGIVGANTGLALGAALAAQRDQPSYAVVCMVGDGAMGTGILYEAMNLASLWSLPVAFVCENNKYAEMTPTTKHLSTAPHERASAFGLDAHEIDGNDVELVQATVSEALTAARSGTPAFVECHTHRWAGHYVGDPQQYRSKNETDSVSDHCPIERFASEHDFETSEPTSLLSQARDLVTELAGVPAA